MKRKFVMLTIVCVLAGALLAACGSNTDGNLNASEIGNPHHSALIGEPDPNNPGGIIINVQGL